MNKELCKHCSKSATFDTEGKEENYFDGVEGVFKSQRGIWVLDGMGVCTKFQNPDTQWEKKAGFYYCDEKRAKICGFFEKGGLRNE